MSFRNRIEAAKRAKEERDSQKKEEERKPLEAWRNDPRYNEVLEISHDEDLIEALHYIYSSLKGESGFGTISRSNSIDLIRSEVLMGIVLTITYRFVNVDRIFKLTILARDGGIKLHAKGDINSRHESIDKEFQSVREFTDFVTNYLVHGT